MMESPYMTPGPRESAAIVPHRRFGVMVKPIGPACNLDCDYCYYLSKEDLLGLHGHEPIADDILEKFIADHIAGNDAAEVEFEWQGGEPTLLGTDFFQKVVDLQKKHCPRGKRAVNSLQTNGLLIDERWCEFLHANRFLVGLSIDGPRQIHDTYRRTKGRQPTFDRVIAAARLLKKHGVEFNTLTVINRTNAKRPLDVYRFLSREIGPRVMQFIPLVEPKVFATVAPHHWDPAALPTVGTPQARPGAPDSFVADWSVDPDDFGEFLCKVFDDWYNRDRGKRFVNLFESFVAVRMGLPSQICVFHDLCGKALLMERDGGLYSCDHFVYPEFRLGNVKDRPLVDTVFCERQVKFGCDKSDTLPKYCRACPHLASCWGECPRNRFIKTPDGEPGLNYLCPGLKRFFAYADARLNAIAAEVRRDAG